MISNYNGNILVRRLVIAADFVLLNLVLTSMAVLFPGTLAQMDALTVKMTYFMANTALLIAQCCYATIIHVRRVGFRQVMRRTFLLTVLSLVLLFLALKSFFPELALFYPALAFGALYYVLIVVSRFLELLVLKFFRSRGYNNRTAVMVGNDPALLEMHQIMMEDPSEGYHIKGYYADSEMKKAPKGLKWLGTLDDMDRIIADNANTTIDGSKMDFNDLICCLSHADSERIVSVMHFCERNVIRFFYLPRQFGEYRMHLDARNFMGKTVYTNHKEPLSSPVNRAVKRLFDIVVSGLVCLLMLPFLPLIALLIKVQSPGPIFFKQKRTGMNGKTFECLKFRSMHVNDSADTAQATADDPRKFAFGNFMRKTNIDEFPQFLNVLRGDMSIVGPRPHMLHHTEVYGHLINRYMVRHFARPGITGWAQVTGFRGETKELWQMEERVRRDIWYIENWSFWLDLRIMVLTAWSIIHPDKNAY